MSNEEVEAAENQLFLRINGPWSKEMGDWLKASTRPKALLTDKGGGTIKAIGLICERENITDAGNSMRGDGLNKPVGRVGHWREGDHRKVGLEGGLKCWSDSALNFDLLLHTTSPYFCRVSKPNLVIVIIPMRPGHCRALSLFPVFGQNQWFQDFFIKYLWLSEYRKFS